MINHCESSNTSSSDLDVAQLDDYKPLLKSNINKPQRLQFRSKTTGNLEIDNFKKNEINSMKSIISKSDNNLMGQIQKEHKEQDEVLEDMTTVLQRLQIMSQDIGNEIIEQDELIKETSNQADTTYDKMKNVEKKMTKLIKQNGLTPCKVIVILSCMALILLILIIWS